MKQLGRKSEHLKIEWDTMANILLGVPQSDEQVHSPQNVEKTTQILEESVNEKRKI